MADEFLDAREEELRFLVEADRKGVIDSTVLGDELRRASPRRDMLEALVWSGALEAPTAPPGSGSTVVYGGTLVTDLERELHRSKIDAINSILRGSHGVRLRVTHLGRIRISELRQALRSGRTRDPSGLLDGAHAERALRLAILDAGPEQPLCVGYLDANGLKEVNDRFDHDAGNLYLGAYAEAVLTAVGVVGEAYRLHGGGDEVLVLLPGHDVDRAVAIVRVANGGLAAQKLRYGKAVLPTGSLCAGIVIVRDHREAGADVRKRADAAMKRAKDASGETRPRTPRVAIEGQAQLVDL